MFPLRSQHERFEVGFRCGLGRRMDLRVVRSRWLHAHLRGTHLPVTIWPFKTRCKHDWINPGSGSRFSTLRCAKCGKTNR